MTITRSGHAAYHGEQSIDLGTEMPASWDDHNGGITLENSDGVRGFGGNARHDYEIRISPGEIGAMLSVLAEHASDPTVAQAIKTRLAAMVRLTNAAAEHNP